MINRRMFLATMAGVAAASSAVKPANQKGKIIQIGRAHYGPRGERIISNWIFSGAAVGFDFGRCMAGGYTFEELREISLRHNRFIKFRQLEVTTLAPRCV